MANTKYLTQRHWPPIFAVLSNGAPQVGRVNLRVVFCESDGPHSPADQLRHAGCSGNDNVEHFVFARVW